MYCPTCNGKGRVETTTEEYGKITITCPHCKCSTYNAKDKAYLQYVEYPHYCTTQGVIKSLNIFQKENGETKVDYNIAVDYYPNTICCDEENICVCPETNANRCKELNEKCYKEAEAKLKL